MKKTVLTSLCIATVILSGCASIMNEKTQPINVSASNGKEVTGTIDGQAFKTPSIVNVTRENKDKIVLTNTEGCAKETSMEKSVDSKFYINILTGGVWGSSTDYGTDKMWRYSENIVISCK